MKAFLGTLAVVTICFLGVSSFLWQAPLFGEDAMVVSWLEKGGIAEGAADFARPQYGLSSVRFYRPLVSLSIAVQAQVSTNPFWLRSENLAVFLLGIAAACAIARKLGAGNFGALFVGIWMCAFPGGPGDWCWIVGRVDAYSFGFGMLGLAAVALGGAGARWHAPASFLLLALAALSKESAVSYALAAPILGFGIDGLAGLRRGAIAAAGAGAVLIARAFALEGATGGYIGAPPVAENLAANATFSCADSLGMVVLGAPWYVLLAFAAVGVRGARLGRGSFLLAILAWTGILLCFLLPILAAVRLAGDDPIQSRLFPGFFAFLGIGLAGWICDITRDWRLRALAFAVLCVLPAIRAGQAIVAFRAAGESLRGDYESIEAHRKQNPQLAIVQFAQAFQGFPEARPQLLLYNLGIPERFAPPFAPAGAAVWPLRPALGHVGGEALAVRANDPAVVFKSRPPHGGIRFFDGPVLHVSPEIRGVPASLSRADAEGIAAGTFDVPMSVGNAPNGSRLRLTILTPVGAAWTFLNTANLTWRGILTAHGAGSSTELYQLFGFAIDYRYTRALLRFEWVDLQGNPISDPSEHALDVKPDFADYIRETLADPAFGIRRGGASSKPK